MIGLFESEIAEMLLPSSSLFCNNLMRRLILAFPVTCLAEFREATEVTNPFDERIPYIKVSCQSRASEGPILHGHDLVMLDSRQGRGQLRVLTLEFLLFDSEIEKAVD